MEDTDPQIVADHLVASNNFGKATYDRTLRYADGYEEVHQVTSIGPSVTIFGMVEDDPDGVIRVIIVKEYKEGIGRRHLACAGARINATEDAIDAAARRLLQETGYAPRPPAPHHPAAISLGKGPYMARSAIDEVDIVILRNCHKVAEPQLRPREFVEVFHYDLVTLLNLIHCNEISDVNAGNATLRALLHLGWFKLQLPSR